MSTPSRSTEPLAKSCARSMRDRTVPRRSRSSGAALHEDHRGFFLSQRNAPIRAEKSRFLFGRDQTKTVSLVKADGPLGGGPGTDQQRLRGLACKHSQERAANAPALMSRRYIRMANQSNIAHLLKAHDTDERVRLIPTPEVDPGG